MSFFLFFVGFLLITIGCAYIFQKETVLSLNAWMRDHVFRDAYVLLDGRRIGGMLIVAGLIIFILTLKLTQ